MCVRRYNRGMSLTESIKETAFAIGFDLVGITPAEPLCADEQAYLHAWLRRDCAAGMPWMHRNLDKRTCPAALLTGARSVICTATAYGPPAPETDTPPTAEPHGRIAEYARLDDYHVFLKERLFALAEAIVPLAGGARPRFKICVDSAPLAERSLARRAGLGFIGKNHMLTNEHLGSQILLGEIVTDLALEPDKPAQTPCTGCNRCIQACPTGALRPDGGFDSARCISYLTVESRRAGTGPIDSTLASLIGDRLFGCDECSLACPYTQNAPRRLTWHGHPAHDSRPGRPCHPLRIPPPRRPHRLPLNEIVSWRGEQFMKCFANSPVERLGMEGLKRNAGICLANAGPVLDHGATKTSSGSRGDSFP